MKATLTLPALRPYQQQFMQDPTRRAACVSCTQIGKTFVCGCWMLAGMWACRCPHPGGWFAPTFPQTMKGHDTIEALAKSAGIYSRRGSKLTPHPVISLINGKRIEFGSWERPETIQGATICRCVVDESGMLNQKAQGAISSRLSETLGPTRYIGNPGMVAGPWRKVCTLAEVRKEKTGFGFYRWTWKDRRDAYLAAGDEVGARRYENFIEEERQSIADFEFRRLYEASWTEDEAAVFTGVDAASYGLPLKTGTPGQRYSTGIDVGQQQDMFALIAISTERRAVAMERFRGIPSPQQAERVKAFMKRFPGVALLEMNGPGVQLYPVLRKMGIKVKAFTTTHASKNEIIMSLAGGLSSGDLTLALMPPLQHELKAFRYQRTTSMSLASYRYGAPPGEHDDCVMSLAFAWHMAQRAVEKAAWAR